MKNSRGIYLTIGLLLTGDVAMSLLTVGNRQMKTIGIIMLLCIVAVILIVDTIQDP